MSEEKDYSETYGAGPWKAVEKEETLQEKYTRLINTNQNMPYPQALQDRPAGDMLVLNDEDIKRMGIKIDEKGHPLKPSNQRKYWKNIRKQRRLKSKT